jgi:hypothetical protein
MPRARFGDAMRAAVEQSSRGSRVRRASRGRFADLARFAGVARFDGCVVVARLRRDRVAAMLPDDLELPSAGPVRGDEHPVIFALGQQRDTAFVVAGRRIPFPVRYGEFAVAVPCVRHRRRRDLYTYVPRMVSSYFPATWTGNEYYGLGKQMGHVVRDAGLILLTDEADRLSLHVVCEPRGSWLATPVAQQPLLAEVRSAFSLQVAGRKASGSWIGCRFDWDFACAQVRSIDSALVVDRLFVPGLAPGCYGGVAAHSFEVRNMHWGLSWPEPLRA